MDEKCECHIISGHKLHNDGSLSNTFTISYCPLHAAAPLMLEACKMAELLLVSIFDVYDVDTKNTVRKLRAAIAAAEPEVE